MKWPTLSSESWNSIWNTMSEQWPAMMNCWTAVPLPGQHTKLQLKKKNSHSNPQTNFKGEVPFSYFSESFFLCSCWGLFHLSVPVASDPPPRLPAPLSTWTSLPVFSLLSFHTYTACVWQRKPLASNKNAVIMHCQAFMIQWDIVTFHNFYHTEVLFFYIWVLMRTHIVSSTGPRRSKVMTSWWFCSWTCNDATSALRLLIWPPRTLSSTVSPSFIFSSILQDTQTFTYTYNIQVSVKIL